MSVNDLSRRGFIKGLVAFTVFAAVPTIPRLLWSSDRPEEFTITDIDTFRLENSFGYGTRGVATHKNGESVYFAIKHEAPELDETARNEISENIAERFRHKFAMKSGPEGRA